MANNDGGPSARFDALCRRAQVLGLVVRGAFHTEPREFDKMLPAVGVGTILLLGFTGSLQWEIYECSAEASDGMPDPLDRWSRRVIGSPAAELGALARFSLRSAAPPLLL